jgi:hypothetical protein
MVRPNARVIATAILRARSNAREIVRCRLLLGLGFKLALGLGLGLWKVLAKESLWLRLGIGLWQGLV